jgi:hypothetical protein
MADLIEYSDVFEGFSRRNRKTQSPSRSRKRLPTQMRRPRGKRINNRSISPLSTRRRKYTPRKRTFRRFNQRFKRWRPQVFRRLQHDNLQHVLYNIFDLYPQWSKYDFMDWLYWMRVNQYLLPWQEDHLFDLWIHQKPFLF